MNRLLCIVLSASISAASSSVFAQKAKQNKYIKNYDVLQYLPEKTDNNPETFWKNITENNQEFRKNMEKFNSPKGSAKQAKNKIESAALRMKSARAMNRPTPEDEKLNNGNRKMVFSNGDDYGVTFGVSSDREWNAYCTPDGHVNINYGLIERLKKDPEMLCGVVAHEVCHYMYRHLLIHEYKSLKKEKQNMIGAAFGAVGTAIGNAAAASGGVQKDYSSDQYTSWFDTAKQQSDMARYKYSREEEAEADIVAYRFLEWIGADPNKYIEALERIDTGFNSSMDDSESDHPTIEFRVGMLRQLKPAPWRNHQN